MGNKTENLQIVERMLEIAKNDLDYSLYPKHFKQEYIFLSNALNVAVKSLEDEFSKEFQKIVGQYKRNLAENKKYGWFHSPEKLCWINMQIQQLVYIIYGDRYTTEKQLVFNDNLGKKAYKDFIEQIDRTVLMTPRQLKKHQDDCNKLGSKIIAEILAEQEK